MHVDGVGGGLDEGDCVQQQRAAAALQLRHYPLQLKLALLPGQRKGGVQRAQVTVLHLGRLHWQEAG